MTTKLEIIKTVRNAFQKFQSLILKAEGEKKLDFR